MYVVGMEADSSKALSSGKNVRENAINHGEETEITSRLLDTVMLSTGRKVWGRSCIFFLEGALMRAICVGRV